MRLATGLGTAPSLARQAQQTGQSRLANQT